MKVHRHGNGLLPGNVHDQTLRAHVRPEGWQNPQPAGKYNLVVIGAGTAGLVSAVGAASLGARVAIVERNLTGGDCLNYGCVPSKALIRGATAAYSSLTADQFGISDRTPVADFSFVMDRMRRLRAEIAPNDSVDRLAGLGIDVFLGQARFTSPETVDVEGNKLRFSRAILATGARASLPEFTGIAETPYYTNETIFSLTARPRHLVIIGAGPVGCELAHAFRRLGSAVSLVTSTDEILWGDDASRVVRRHFEHEGIRLLTGAEVQRLRRDGEWSVISLVCGPNKEELRADALLIATGRTPNTDGLELERAGVRYDDSGVVVDDRLQTSNRRVYAAGDVCSRFKFTHAADALARIALQNALFHGRKKASALVIPSCVFTDPEIAKVGLSDEEAAAAGAASYTVGFEHVDRAILDGETEGFGRVHVDRKSGRILGATIVGKHAGDMIGELVLAMTAGLPMGKLAETILPYPTRGEITKKLGDAYNRERLTPSVKRIFETYFRWTR
jgi:pyruvate/2-oxoglutarate dehydrogenase complex dihydrolipoamide dehydrogenase (E3) component